MKIKELAKKVAENLWWIFKRDSWIVAMVAIIIGKYTDYIPAQSLISFFEKGCLLYIPFIPLGILIVIIFSHMCAQVQKKMKPTAPRRIVLILYVASIMVIFFAHAVTIYVSPLMFFNKPYLMSSNPTLDFWHHMDIAYALIITPVFDWGIFRCIIPRSFTDEKKCMKESRFCNIVNIPRKNMIASTLGFFMLVVILEIRC